MHMENVLAQRHFLYTIHIRSYTWFLTLTHTTYSRHRAHIRLRHEIQPTTTKKHDNKRAVELRAQRIHSVWENPLKRFWGECYVTETAYKCSCIRVSRPLVSHVKIWKIEVRAKFNENMCIGQRTYKYRCLSFDWDSSKISVCTPLSACLWWKFTQTENDLTAINGAAVRSFHSISQMWLSHFMWELCV